MPAEGMDADADDPDVVAPRSSLGPPAAGANAYVSDGVARPPRAAGISVSSIGIPIRSCSGSATVSRASTRTSPGNSMYPTPYGSNASGSSTAYGGDFGGKHWIVQDHSVPDRASSRSRTCKEVQRGHERLARERDHAALLALRADEPDLAADLDEQPVRHGSRARQAHAASSIGSASSGATPTIARMRPT